MTWHEVTWDAYDTSSALVSAVEVGLAAHPAWSFVDETTEVAITPATTDPVAPEFAHWEYPIRVWKNSGAINGTGKDFYVAFVSMLERSTHSDSPKEAGYFGVFGLLGYDVDTHRPLDRLGYALQNNPEFDSDGKLVIDNTLSYPFFEPREESGGTWGTWYNRGLSGPAPTPIQSATDHLMSVTNGAGYNIATGVSAPGEEVYDLRFRVSHDGLFIVNKSNTGAYANPNATYIGAYDLATCPEMFRTETPIFQVGNDRLAFGYNGGVRFIPMLEFPGINSDTSSVYDFSSVLTIYREAWGYNSLSSAPTSRGKFSFSSLEDYVVIPFGLVPGRAYGFGNGLPFSLYNIPGMYFLSTRGMPGSWIQWEDTMTSPNGHECAIFSMDTSSVDSVILIDKER